VDARAVLTLTADTSEGRRRFGVYADTVKDINSVLRTFDEWKRQRIQELFATGGHGQWPERSERSQQRGEARAVAAAGAAPAALLKKLKREYDRAKNKLDRLDPTALENARRLHSGRNAVARRAFVLKRFEEAAAGVFTPAADAKEQRLLARIAPRWERQQARAAAKGRVLGNLPQTVRSQVKGGLLTIDSSWDSPAPAALQEGAKIANDATLPPRPWLYWEPEDIEMLAELFKKRAMLAWMS